MNTEHRPVNTSSTSDAEIFICSFCEKPIRFRQDQRGRRGKCPNCGRAVVLVSNRFENVDDQLTTRWYYRKVRLLRRCEDIGPLDDIKFLELIKTKQIENSTEVMSPELTKGQWGKLRQVKLTVIQERVTQRQAEETRRKSWEDRRRQISIENRLKLKRAIRGAIETGRLSSGQRETIEQFSIKAAIPEVELRAMLASECEGLVKEVFEEALDDGILEPNEEEQLSRLSISLGVNLKFSDFDRRRIALCRLAYQLDSGTFQPDSAATVPFKLAPSERPLGQVPVHWHEVVSLKRPDGVPLGGDSYLKGVGGGIGYLTTKQLSMVGDLQSKKFTLGSVQKVTRYGDGMLFNRSSGRSVFLQMNPMSPQQELFCLIAEHACSGEPVLGYIASSNFIPDVRIAKLAELSSASDERIQRSGSDPKYTFRVVGEFIGNRSDLIGRLSIGERVILRGEPGNPVDPNAVAVFDQSGNQLGYLKRDVASWFVRILEQNPDVVARAHAFTSGGSFIVGVYI